MPNMNMEYDIMGLYLMFMKSNLSIAVFAGGCFWCVEAVLQRIDGVLAVMPGYLGGKTQNPTYEQICRGDTGHAEAVEVTYDPQLVTYEQLLDVFWQMHDPTTLNRQGADRGTHYRSIIFYRKEEEKAIAIKVLNELQDKLKTLEQKNIVS